MRSLILMRLFAGLGLVVGLSTALLAQTSSAMIYASGEVTVNGGSVGGSTSIFSGDQLVTSASSLVSLSQSGSSVTVSPNSSVQYSKAGIDVLQGTARISTINGMVAQAGQVTVSPVSKTAKFDVVRIGDKLFVTSHEGTLTMSDGSRTTTLLPGVRTSIVVAQTIKQGSSQMQEAKFVSGEASSVLSNGPFATIAASPDPIPVCPNVKLCFRPHVSNIRPCLCKVPPNVPPQ